MYQMDWDIRFDNDGKRYRLATLSECEIITSVDNLVDTATIDLPAAVFSQVLNIQDKLGRGTGVTIKLGYDGNLRTEFEGFINDITTNDSTLRIHCEDALFLFRKGVKDVELKPTNMKAIAQLLVDQVDSSFKVSCDYDISYEKFTIHQATAYDVLKKLQEESKANIYFDTEKKVLHIHPPYVEKTGEVKYSLHVNVEKTSLEYKRAIDKKVEVTVESTDVKGKKTSVTKGVTGGDKLTMRVGPMSKDQMEKIAEAALKRNNFDGYTGTFDTWLVPFVKPGYTAHIEDLDYPEKKGGYYVIAVTTKFGPAGAVRTITPGIKVVNGR